MDVNVEMLRAFRGVLLPPDDAPQVGMVQDWFEDHEVKRGAGSYCTPGNFDDWCKVGSGHYEADAEGRERLYRNVVAMFDLGVPLVLLARQAHLYPLFLDLDIYGGLADSEGGEVHSIVWDAEKTLMRSIAAAVLQIFPQFRPGLEIAVFCASGIDSLKGRHKASYHFVFPHIIVDRPEKGWPDAPGGGWPPVRGGHMTVRDHIVCRLVEETDTSGPLARLRSELLARSDYARLEPECDDTEGGPVDAGRESSDELPAYLNDWPEILDDKPLRHEPWPEAATGFRLPYTDKACPEVIVEGRPKVPLGRWLLRSIAQGAGVLVDPQHGADVQLVEQLPEMDPVDWVRLGDISRPDAQEVTPWDAHGLHPDVGDDAFD